jgi:uncharacterized protein YbjT (DUF2867 family)
MSAFQQFAGVLLVTLVTGYVFIRRKFSQSMNLDELKQRQLEKWQAQAQNKKGKKSTEQDVCPPKVILVVGCTGNVGQFAVPALAKRLPQATIRCCIHSKEAPKEWRDKFSNVEFVKMDSTKLDQVEHAMQGCDRVLLIHHATEEQLLGELNCINTAEKLGVKFLCKIGCPPCSDYQETRTLFNRNQDTIQNHLRKLGEDGKLKYTIIRPNFGMANVFMIALPSIKYGYCFWPWRRTEDGKYCRVSIADPRDQADVAVATLCDSKFTYHTREIFVHGPEAIDAEELTAILAEGVGKPLKFKAVSSMFYYFMLRPMIGYHLAMSVANVFNELLYFNTMLSETDTTELEEILERKPYTLKSYLLVTGIAEMSDRLKDWERPA